MRKERDKKGVEAKVQPKVQSIGWRVNALAMAFLTGLLFAGQQQSLAQMNSMGTFSPYTMYGIGDMAVGGNAFNRGMGGVGVGYRNPGNFNYLNPAALSGMLRNTALFNFAGEGSNIYSKTDAAKTTYNTFNIHDLGLAVPLGRGIGLGFSLTPVSSLGYTTSIVDENPQVIEDIGRTIYSYSGEGGISQVSMSLGLNIIPQLAVGVSANYWFGSMTRQFSATTYSYLTPNSYRTVYASDDYNVSKILFVFGAQYTFVLGAKGNALTIGATYQPKVNASLRYKQQVISISQYASDTVHFDNTRSDMAIPEKFAAGIFYQSPKFSAGFDYSRQDWKGAFNIPADQLVSLSAKEDYKIGFSYSPNPYDIRRTMNRWTYKIGGRYGTSYLVSNGQKLHDMAVTLGTDFALKKGSVSKVGLGLELGQRGSTKQGQVRERYFNFVVALSLFGDDYWFVRPKYN